MITPQQALDAIDKKEDLYYVDLQKNWTAHFIPAGYMSEECFDRLIDPNEDITNTAYFDNTPKGVVFGRTFLKLTDTFMTREEANEKLIQTRQTEVNHLAKTLADAYPVMNKP